MGGRILRLRLKVGRVRSAGARPPVRIAANRTAEARRYRQCSAAISPFGR